MFFCFVSGAASASHSDAHVTLELTRSLARSLNEFLVCELFSIVRSAVAALCPPFSSWLSGDTPALRGVSATLLLPAGKQRTPPPTLLPPPDQEHLAPLRCVVFLCVVRPSLLLQLGSHTAHSKIASAGCSPQLGETVGGSASRTPGPARPAAQSVKCSLRWSEVELMFNTMRR